MTAVFCVDTALLAIPNYAEDEIQAESIILKLKEWSDAASALGRDRIARSSSAELDLGALGFFPGLKNVEDLIDFSGLKGVYDAKTVWSTYNNILNRSGILEETSGIEISKIRDVQIKPDILDKLAPVDLRRLSEAMLVAIGFANQISGTNKFLFAGASDERCDDVDVYAWIEEARGINCELPAALPAESNNKVALVGCLSDGMKSVRSDKLWNIAVTLSDFYFSIAMRCMEILADSGLSPSFSDIPRFVLGSNFVQSIRNHGGFGEGPFVGTILESCARVVLGNPKEPLKPFGKPEQMVRKRDKAKALRSHITSKGVGLRLMVWMKPCGTVEIANIGPKFELEIEEGVRLEEYTISTGRH